MINMYIVWLSFKRAVFVLQNSLPLWSRRVYFYDIAWHFISYTDFRYDLRHEKFTKRYENWQTLS